MDLFESVCRLVQQYCEFEGKPSMECDRMMLTHPLHIAHLNQSNSIYDPVYECN